MKSGILSLERKVYKLNEPAKNKFTEAKLSALVTKSLPGLFEMVQGVTVASASPSAIESAPTT